MTQSGHGRGRRTFLAAAAGALAAPSLARAQGEYPSRSITIVVPSPAGGGTDFSARLISDPLSRAFGVPVVVENRPGGNDVVGLNAVLQARPDGYTLLMGYCGTMTGRAALGTLGQIDAIRDFAPIGQVSDTPQLFVTHPSVPASTMREFVAHARQRPGEIAYASAGNGSLHHLSAELLKLRTGIDMLHVPYRGTGETIATSSQGASSSISIRPLPWCRWCATAGCGRWPSVRMSAIPACRTSPRRRRRACRTST
jgi:tripartite-type tricarboxylate transporter receptor subunit TctC